METGDPSFWGESGFIPKGPYFGPNPSANFVSAFKRKYCVKGLASFLKRDPFCIKGDFLEEIKFRVWDKDTANGGKNALFW